MNASLKTDSPVYISCFSEVDHYNVTAPYTCAGVGFTFIFATILNIILLSYIEYINTAC